MNSQDEEAKCILEQWARLKGHERCWWYPEYSEPLAEIYNLSLENVVLTPVSIELFEEGCARFREEQYGSRNREMSAQRELTVKEAFSIWIGEQKGKILTYHDEILQTLAEILHVEIPARPNVPREELKRGCRDFQL